MYTARKLRELLKRSKVRVSSDVDERILGDVMERPEMPLKEGRAARSGAGIWRRVVQSEGGRLGLVAVLVAALVLVVYWYGGSIQARDVSWTEVARNIGKAEAVSYRMRMSKRPASQVVVYESETEISDGPSGDVQIGEYLEAERDRVLIGFGQRGRAGGGRRPRTRASLDVPRGEFTDMAEKTLAKGMVERFLSAGGEKLPSQRTAQGLVEILEVIDVEALGLKDAGVRSATGWLSVDGQTNLPVAVEIEINFEDGARTRVWLDAFEWDLGE